MNFEKWFLNFEGRAKFSKADGDGRRTASVSRLLIGTKLLQVIKHEIIGFKDWTWQVILYLSFVKEVFEEKWGIFELNSPLLFSSWVLYSFWMISKFVYPKTFLKIFLSREMTKIHKEMKPSIFKLKLNQSGIHVASPWSGLARWFSF